MLTPAEQIVADLYFELREKHDYRYDSLTHAGRPPGLHGHYIRVDHIAARKAGQRTGVGLKRVIEVLWRDERCPRKVS